MQLTIFDALLDDSRAGLSGKTCQASSQQKTTPSAPSWADWSGVTPPSFRATDGQTQVWLMDPAAAPHGGSWTPSTSDWLSDGSGSSCSLSSILEVGPHLMRYLPVIESVRWHSPPRREAGQRPAPTISARTKGGGGLGTDAECDGALIPILDGAKGRTNSRGSRDGSAFGNPWDPMFTLRGGSAHAVAIQAGALRENPDSGPDGVGVQEGIAYTIEARAEVQAVAYNITPSQSNKDYNARPTQRAQAVTTTGNRPSARGGDVIAFGSKEYAQDAGDVSPPLRAMGHDESHQNGGGQVAIAYQTSGNCGAWETGDMVGALDTMTDPNSHVVAFDARQSDVLHYGDPSSHVVSFALRGRDGGAQVEINGDGDQAGALRAAGGGSSRDYVATQWAVRRLTPQECERLQGAPDDWTLVTYRGKPMADGPRYKMIGNSWAVPCVRWIGERIDLVQSELDKAA